MALPAVDLIVAFVMLAITISSTFVATALILGRPIDERGRLIDEKDVDSEPVAALGRNGVECGVFELFMRRRF